ncbi:hypothetical protein FTUN_4439 [Frigoriglobus tundricola]|uniref:Uncharacterized protein n=1 Tax=Frigoriglobus tundricola TaxID=2774151 RepID=A0A6M5YSP0_9BACT|nr:hypothetical protein FTUN_4439 [Frigoriglobus tundricola]
MFGSARKRVVYQADAGCPGKSAPRHPFPRGRARWREVNR